MLYEFKNKVYLKVGNKYVESSVKKTGISNYNVVPTKVSYFVREMPNARKIELKEAYELSNKKEMNKEKEVE